MARLDNLRLDLFGTRNGGIKVLNLKPKENAISVWFEVWVSEWTVVMLHIPAVQLKDQSAVPDDSLVFRATMPALTAKQPLIPAAARFNVVHADEGL